MDNFVWGTVARSTDKLRYLHLVEEVLVLVVKKGSVQVSPETRRSTTVALLAREDSRLLIQSANEHKVIRIIIM